MLLVLAALAALVGGLREARAAPADRLVIRTQEVPGLRSGSSGIVAARREFARLAPKRPRRVESARYRGPGRVRLEVRAAELRTVGHAKVTLRVWRKTERRRGFRARALRGTGGPALIAVRRRRGTTDVRIALRRRAGVALIRYRTRHGARVARRIATGIARIEGRRLQAALSRTAWDRAIDGIRADGSVPDRTVLQLTSLLYGQVPGVTLPGGARRVRESDGTWVLEQLRAVGPRLSPARRRAVARRLSGRRPSGKGTTGTTKRATQAGCLTEVGGRPLDVALSTLGTSFRDAMAARVPGYGTPTWHVCVYRASDPAISAAADTVPYQTALTSDPFDLGFFDPLFVATGTFDMCHVRIHPSFSANSAINRRWALAHEMYHCLRQETNGQNAYDAPKPPPWAEEGLADWAAHEVSPASYVPVSNLPANHYSKYLETTFNGLFGQSYDAFGFFGRVEQSIGASALWSRVPGVWAAGSSSPGAYAAITGADEQKILSEWGSGLFRRPAFPEPWFQQRPFANTSPSAEVRLVSPATPGVSRHEVSDHRPELYLAVSPIPLVRVSIEGAGRVSDGATDWPQPVDRWFCFGGGCTCPSGQTEARPIPEHTDLADGFLYAGIAAGAGTSALVLDAHSLSEYCDPEDGASEGPVPPGGGGSNGDPHLVTFDGRRYDFQAAGEFVLARGPGIEVQARQEPWRRSRYVSINTQLAMRVGSAKVVFSPGKVPLVDVGRGPRRVGARLPLRGGGSITPATRGDSCADLVVRWPNGSVACVFSVGPWGLALRVVPGPAARGKMTGLLGDADGDQGNDFRTRGGRRLNPRLMNGRGRAGYTALYRTLGDSWRVRQGESLLRYARGQSTATFTDRDFPARAFGLRDLSSSRRSRAEARCRARGVRDPELLEDCIVDVALTGRTAFATAAAEEQRVAVPPPTKLGDGDRPWVLVDREGTTHVVWRRSVTSGADELHYRRREVADADFGPDQVLPVDSGSATEDFEGPVILQDPDPSGRLVILVSRCCRGPGTYALTSGDGGRTWSTGTAVYDGAFGTGPENGRTNIAAVAGGTIQIVSGGRQIAPLPAALAPLQPRGIAQPGADASFDSGVAAGPDGTVLAWSDLDRGSVRIAGTGATFDAGQVRTVDIAGSARATVLLSTSDESIGRRLEARPVGGGGLGAPVRVSAAGDGDPIFPWLGADPSGGFHAVWVTSSRDLAYSRSADGGSWSAPKPLAYAPSGPGIFHPVVATGASGGWAAWDENSSSGSVYAAPVPGS